MPRVKSQPKAAPKKTVKTSEMTEEQKKAAALAAEAAKAQKEADKAAQKAKKEAERAAEKEAKDKAKAEAAVEKEKAVAAATKTADKSIKEIRDRLERAVKLDKQGDDHRLAAGIRLAEVKKTLTEAGASFKEWYDKNVADVGYKFESVRKLVFIGEQPDPVKALADMRAGNKENMKKAREKAKAEKEAQKALPKPKNLDEKGGLDKAIETIKAAPDSTQVDTVKSLAKQHGLAVVSQKAAEALASQSGNDPAAHVIALFMALPAKDKGVVLDTIGQKTGMALVNKAGYDEYMKNRAAQ